MLVERIESQDLARFVSAVPNADDAPTGSEEPQQ
jgi:hypothetical protein